jgi:electron transport complex protein RnfA
VALLITQKQYNLIEGTVYAIGNALGFALALFIFAGIRENLELMEVPKGLRGMPIALITAGILSLAFMGFANLV